MLECLIHEEEEEVDLEHNGGGRYQQSDSNYSEQLEQIKLETARQDLKAAKLRTEAQKVLLAKYRVELQNARIQQRHLLANNPTRRPSSVQETADKELE